MNKFNEITNLENSSDDQIESKFSRESKPRTQSLCEQYADYLKPIPPVLLIGRRSSYPPQRRSSPVKSLQCPCETDPEGCDPARKKRRGRALDTANKGTQPANNLSTSAGKALAPQGHPPVKKKRRLSKSAKAAAKAVTRATAKAAAKAAARFAIEVAADAAAKQAAAVAAKAAAEPAAKEVVEAATRRLATWCESDTDSVSESDSESDTESDAKSNTESDAKSESNIDTTVDTN